MVNGEWWLYGRIGCSEKLVGSDDEKALLLKQHLVSAKANNNADLVPYSTVQYVPVDSAVRESVGLGLATSGPHLVLPFVILIR